jgi:galactan endo-1,6-beta-galactosidase
MTNQIRKLIRLRTAIALFTILLGQTSMVRADYSVNLNPRQSWGVWEGWGTSLAWWAKVFGQSNQLADLMFTTNYVTLNGYNLPGLGLNIVRYNAGASSWVPITNGNNVETMVVPWTMNPDRQMEGFWINWNSTNAQDPTSANWNWDVDVNQRNMLQKAKERGANRFELFANSPMWWMCYNKNPCGNGGSDNLQWWNYNDHAVYLATVAQYAKTNWGITFDGVEPFNEPIDSWWVAEGAQEGCHYDRSTQAAVIQELRNELDERGLTNMPIAASDEFGYDRARDTWNSFSEDIKSKIGRVNVHGYQFGGGRRDLLHDAVAPYGAPIWLSEFGDTDATGENMAWSINLDFRWMRLTAWCYWQPLDIGNWGLIHANTNDKWIGEPRRKYYVMAHYSRHIRAGMTILDGYHDDTVVAYDKSARKLVLVTMSYNTPQTVTYNLTNFFRAEGPVRRWVTELGNANVSYVESNNIVIGSNLTFQASFAADTLQTFEIENVDIYGPPPSISCTASNGTMTLAWPASHLGWIVQSNRFGIGPSNGWFDIPGTSSATNLNIVPGAINMNVFYRLRSP